jgi:hypothetical protein
MKRNKLLISLLRLILVIPASIMILPIFWLLYAFAHEAWGDFLILEAKKVMGDKMKKHGLKEITWVFDDLKDET